MIQNEKEYLLSEQIWNNHKCPIDRVRKHEPILDDVISVQQQKRIMMLSHIPKFRNNGSSK